MTQDQTARVWRSLLYMPADNPKFLAKAQERGADALILDLEDSVAPHNKAAARATCRQAIADLAPGPADILVRINAPLRHAIRDLEAVVQPGLNALFLPKTESAGMLVALDAVVASLEAEAGMPYGTVGFVPMIETPKALLAAERIAAATSRNVALILGGEDFATAAHLTPSAETLTPPKLQVALAARAAGLMPIGILDTVADFSDPEVMYRTALRSAAFGFVGATCIHPTMVAPLNRAFSPSADDISAAQQVVTVMEAAWQTNAGAAQINGKMIDMPVYERAKDVLARATAISGKNG